MEMIGGVLIELQRPGQRVEDRRRRVVVAALLEPDEIVGAHTGEQRKLLAAKARYTPAAETREADVLGDPLAPRAQKLAEMLGGVHHRGRYSLPQRRGWS
jgi:hypothetical protein